MTFCTPANTLAFTLVNPEKQFLATAGFKKQGNDGG